MSSTDQINAAHQRRKDEHEMRLKLRPWAQTFGHFFIPATLWGVVLYGSLVRLNEVETLFWKLIYLLPLIIAAAVILADSKLVRKYVGAIFSAKILQWVTRANEVSSNQVGFVLSFAVALAVFDWLGLLKLLAVLAVMLFLAVKFLPIKAWLAKEPDFSTLKTPDEIRREAQDYAQQQASAQSGADEDSNADNNVGLIDLDGGDDDDLLNMGDGDGDESNEDGVGIGGGQGFAVLTGGAADGHEEPEAADVDETVDPDLADAIKHLQGARTALAAAEAEVVPENETEAAGKKRRARLGGRKGQVTRWTNRVIALGGEPEAVE